LKARPIYKTNMMSFWRRVLDRVESDGRVFVALVVDHSIHSPGTTGARLAVFESGETVGTLGGGIMEVNLVERARAALSDQTFEPELRTLHHRKHGDGEKSGLICAGYQTNLCLILERRQALAELEQAVEGESAQGGFLELTPSGIRFRQDSDLTRGEQSRLVANGNAWQYIERLVNFRRVAILGGGLCGLAF
jgi:xanthine/CO dehydrogenase XdhC/CoxF family maturation factor